MVRHPHPLVSPSLPAVALKRLYRTRFHHQAPIWASKAFVLRQFAEIPSPASRNVEISSSFDVLRSSGASGRDQNEFMNVHAPSTTPGDGVLRLQLPHVKEPIHAHVQLCLGLCGLPRHHPARQSLRSECYASALSAQKKAVGRGINATNNAFPQTPLHTSAEAFSYGWCDASCSPTALLNEPARQHSLKLKN